MVDTVVLDVGGAGNVAKINHLTITANRELHRPGVSIVTEFVSRTKKLFDRIVIIRQSTKAVINVAESASVTIEPSTPIIMICITPWSVNVSKVYGVIFIVFLS